MQQIHNKEFGGERPLYRSADLLLDGVTIHVGESSVKESRNIRAEGCRFEGKYVFWENTGVSCRDCYFAPSARSSIWYSRDISLTDCVVDAPKMFRRASGIRLQGVRLNHAEETFWDCRDIRLEDCEILEADNLFMHCSDIQIERYRQEGNYSFQYTRHVEIRDAVIRSKDAFWDSDYCTLIDCEIDGEYLGWYSRNLRLIRCRISGTQPLCYCQDLILEDCTFAPDCDLAFEYSTLQATVRGHLDSIKNPTSGKIVVDSVREVILDKNIKAPANCRIEISRP